MPPTSTSFFAKLSAITTSEFVPWRFGSALKLGESMTVNSGAWSAAERWIDDEQIAGEQVVPRVLVDHPDRQTVCRIGAGVAVLDEQLLPRE